MSIILTIVKTIESSSQRNQLQSISFFVELILSSFFFIKEHIFKGIDKKLFFSAINSQLVNPYLLRKWNSEKKTMPTSLFIICGVNRNNLKNFSFDILDQVDFPIVSYCPIIRDITVLADS